MYVSVAISVQFAVNHIASRSGIVAMALHAPKHGQDATHFSLAELAKANPAAGGMTVLGPSMVTCGIVPASSQAQGPLWAPDLQRPKVDQVGFILMLIEQAESAQFLMNKNIGLMVTVLGPESRVPQYPPGVKAIRFLVTWTGGRNQQLQEALPLIVEALSQGKNVGVHCLSSFHRGPLALCAIGHALFGWDVGVTLKYIGTKRQIYGPYLTDAPLLDDRLAGALRWAKTVKQYEGESKPAALSQVPVAPWKVGAASSSSAAAPSQPILKGAKMYSLDNVTEFLFRAMTPDGSEFLNGRGSKRTLTGETLVNEIIRAVEHGSHERSEFLHFSTDFVKARTWYIRGQCDRGEKSGRLCRIRLADLRALEEQTRAALSQDCDDITARVGSVFDLSSEKGIKLTFGKKWGNSDVVENNVHKLRTAMTNKEVLVAFRGDIPATMFDLIDSESGNFIASLKSVGDKVAAAVRGPRFFHTSHSQHSTVQIVYGTVLYCSVCTRFSSFRFDVWKS